MTDVLHAGQNIEKLMKDVNKEDWTVKPVKLDGQTDEEIQRQIRDYAQLGLKIFISDVHSDKFTLLDTVKYLKDRKNPIYLYTPRKANSEDPHEDDEWLTEEERRKAKEAGVTEYLEGTDAQELHDIIKEALNKHEGVA